MRVPFVTHSQIVYLSVGLARTPIMCIQRSMKVKIGPPNILSTEERTVGVLQGLCTPYDFMIASCPTKSLFIRVSRRRSDAKRDHPAFDVPLRDLGARIFQPIWKHSTFPPHPTRPELNSLRYNSRFASLYCIPHLRSWDDARAYYPKYVV